jgi:hypothetical protein
VGDLDSLLRGTIGHGVARLIVLLGTGELKLAVLGFLVLLGEIAEGAAAGAEDIGDAVSLEVILAADLGALHCLGNPVETDAGRGEEEESLKMLICKAYLVASTYRGVDGLITLQAAVLAGSVVGLAKGDAGAAVCQQACHGH